MYTLIPRNASIAAACPDARECPTPRILRWRRHGSERRTTPAISKTSLYCPRKMHRVRGSSISEQMARRVSSWSSVASPILRSRDEEVLIERAEVLHHEQTRRRTVADFESNRRRRNRRQSLESRDSVRIAPAGRLKLGVSAWNGRTGRPPLIAGSSGEGGLAIRSGRIVDQTRRWRSRCNEPMGRSTLHQGFVRSRVCPTSRFGGWDYLRGQRVRSARKAAVLDSPRSLERGCARASWKKLRAMEAVFDMNKSAGFTGPTCERTRTKWDKAQMDGGTSEIPEPHRGVARTVMWGGSTEVFQRGSEVA